MGQMETWELILVGILVAIVVLWMGPGVKRTLQSSSKGSTGDWLGLAGVLGIVVVFIFLLIALV